MNLSGIPNHSMRVAILARLGLRAGGLLPAVAGLVGHLDRELWRPVIFGFRDSRDGKDDSAWKDIEVRPYSAWGPWKYSSTLLAQLEEFAPDLIHLNGLWFYDQYVAALYQKKHHIPVIVSPHGMLQPMAMKKSAWKKFLCMKLFAERALRQTTCIHALCLDEYRNLRAAGYNNPIAVIGNGVDEIADMPPPQRTPPPVRRLVFVSRLAKLKGADRLLEALALLKKNKNLPLQIVITGWGDQDYVDGLFQICAQNNLKWAEGGKAYAQNTAADVIFTGPLFGAEKRDLLCRADAFILPSYNEGLPMAILEAWQHRLPVLMTDACNLPVGFENHAAWRIDPDDLPGLAAALERFVQAPYDELVRMGQRGYETVTERFAWSEVAEQMSALYRWCLNNADQPDFVMTGPLS